MCSLRPYTMSEEQMKWFNGKFPDTAIPRELLRSHLSEVLNPYVMNQQSSCLGNRVAAVQVGQQSLVFTCCGSAGQKVTLNVLRHQAGSAQVCIAGCCCSMQDVHVQLCLELLML